MGKRNYANADYNPADIKHMEEVLEKTKPRVKLAKKKKKKKTQIDEVD